MTQLERLIARVVQLVEDNPGTMVGITVAVDAHGAPICWMVNQKSAEGLQETKNCDKITSTIQAGKTA